VSRGRSGSRSRWAGVAVVCSLGLAVVPSTASARDTRDVDLEDRCDRVTFNAVIGEGTCVGDGDVTFEEFAERLNPDDFGHGAWRFSREQVELRRGEKVVLDNVGGEFHTFTEVATFGAGIVPELNAVLPPGTPPATIVGDFLGLGAGQKAVLSTPSVGTHRYQCMIHPWMRTVVKQTARR
jgi:plastocyanin